MEYKTHKVGGLCAGAIASTVLTSQFAATSYPLTNPVMIGTVITVVSATVGSLLPDIDHSNSYISRKNPLVAFVVKIFLSLSQLITNILLFFCPWISKERKKNILSGMEHRGIFHTLLMTVGIYFLSGYIISLFKGFPYGECVQIGIVAGYLSHLLVDMMTVGGVMLLYPLITYKFRWPFLKLRTGENEGLGKLIIIVISAILLFLIIKM